MAAGFHTGAGGGFGLNFFFLRYFGIGYEAAWYSITAEPQNICPLAETCSSAIPSAPGTSPPMYWWAVALRGMEMPSATEMSEAVSSIASPTILVSFVDGRYFYGNKDFGNVANLRAGMRFAF